MAAELGTLNLGTLQGTLILRLDDGTEVEVGTLAVPLNAQVSVTMPGAVQSATPTATPPEQPEANPLARPSIVRQMTDAQWPVGTRVRVADDARGVLELQGRTGVLIDPATRTDLGDDQVLVHIPSYESRRDDRAWSFNPDRLVAIG